MTTLLRVPVSELRAGETHLEGATARYVARVHRVSIGQSLELFDPDTALVARAVVLDVGKARVVLKVQPPVSSPVASLPIVLVQGIGKGGKPEQVLRDATALAVRKVVLAETARGTVRLAEAKHASRRDRWRRVTVEAARQCGRSDVPCVVGPISLKAALAEAESGRRIVLAPGASPLLEVLSREPLLEPLTLLIGPEGGLTPSEVDEAGEAGFVSASLGGNILRTELAAAAALGAVVAFLHRGSGQLQRG